MSDFSTKGKMTVERHYGNVDSFNESDIEVKSFKSEPARITATYGFTVKIKDFDMARADVSVELPCYPEEIEDAFEVAWSKVNSEIKKQLESVKRLKAKRK